MYESIYISKIVSNKSRHNVKIREPNEKYVGK